MAARKPPQAQRLRQALLLLAQDARKSSFELPTRPLIDEIARRENITVAQVGAWLRGQLAFPDPAAQSEVAKPRAWTEAQIRAVVREEITASATPGR